MRTRTFGSMVIAAVLGSALTIGTFHLIGDDGKTVKIEHVDNTPAKKTNFSTDESNNTVPVSFAASAEKVIPSVVYIQSTSISQSRNNSNQIPEAFRDFFGPYMRENEGMPRVGSGSGVIISAEGHIITNNHVIDNADDIEVTLSDNRTYKGTVIGADPMTDIALIKIEENGLPFLRFTDSDAIKVGEWVLAVGNPYSLNSTVTAGIVSAKARSIGILATPSKENPNVSEGIESFIQTDAAVNPGNSGGALVNLNGDLVGINTAIASPTGSYSGYSFAVPSNIVSKVVEDLLEYGVVQRGWLGVMIQSVNDALAKEHDLSVLQGAYVENISEKSGAKDAGMKEGDVIVKVDGHKVITNSDVIGYIGSKKPGDVINILVNRKGKEIELAVTLKNRQGNTNFIEKTDDLIARLGVDLEEVEKGTLKRLNLENGVKITKLHDGLLKRQTDIREGFIITHIGGTKIEKVDDVERILKATKGGVMIEGRYENYPGTKYYAFGLDS